VESKQLDLVLLDREFAVDGMALGGTGLVKRSARVHLCTSAISAVIRACSFSCATFDDVNSATRFWHFACARESCNSATRRSVSLEKIASSLLHSLS
jgi:hypothetical protein